MCDIDMKAPIFKLKLKESAKGEVYIEQLSVEHKDLDALGKDMDRFIVIAVGKKEKLQKQLRG